MEEYKEKYEEIVKKIKEAKESMGGYTFSSVVDKIIPELKESEDEMIRKWLIKAMKHLSEESTFFLKVPKDKVIAWLEKQGEQKPIDKVEPKFKLGDWVVHKETGTIHQIQQCVEMPTAHTYGYDLTDGGYINTFRTDEYRLWTIQDAKDGDVLYIHSFESDCVFLYQNTYEIEPNRNVAVAYCCIDVYANKIEFGIQGPDCIDVRNVKPATKEQRDLLFQKMKEAGYEWDAEKKELKKIEQKPISIVDDWIEDYWKHYKVNNPDSYDKGEEIQFDHDGFVRFCQTHCPKPAWSEEDEWKFSDILALLRGGENFHYNTPELFDWLKSHKERMKGE